MKLTSKLALAGVAAALMFALPATPASAADGKELIKEQKCITCHSVKNLGIEKTKKSRGPDLSGVGLEHDAAWITKWLLKEQDKKSAYGDKQVKHKKKWKGSEADLKTVAEFLAAQKTKVDVKDDAGEDDGGDE